VRLNMTGERTWERIEREKLRQWNLPALTRRDAAATSPLGALDLAAPPAFLTPPDLPAPALAWGTW
jgi:hypothetical protein